jgi:uncharacterized protein (TIGR02271 family)
LINQPNLFIVTDAEGARGALENFPSPGGGPAADWVTVRLENGQHLPVPARHLVPQSDGTFFFNGSLAAHLSAAQGSSAPARPPEGEHTSVVMPLIAEELEVGKRQVETGKVRITKKIHEREEIIDEPLLAEQVTVERVPVNKVVDGPVPIRQEGDTMVISLLEEVLVVEKRLVLKEELRITRRRVETHKPQRVILRTEGGTIERLGPEEH